MIFVKRHSVKIYAIALVLALAAYTGAGIAAAAAAPTATAAVATSAKDGSDQNKENEIKEIDTYLRQMEPADVAGALKLFRAMKLVRAGYVADVSDSSLLNGALKGAVGSMGDPHTIYLDPKMYNELMISTKGSYSGVGIVIGIKDKLLKIIAPIEGTAGDKAGLLNGDHIVKIDGTDTKDMLLDEAVNKIRGPENTVVTLTIDRDGEDEKDYTITRGNIELKSVQGKMLDNGIGYIRISMFNVNTSNDFYNKLQELKQQDLKAVILDLRNNPGGLVEEGVKVAEQFVPQGPVVSVIIRDGTKQTYFSTQTPLKYPLVVLVNGGSASASEIVAGAIQDTGAGTLLGTKTYGKGSVQSVLKLDNESALKLTVAKYYTPSGRCIDGVGIDADVVVMPAESKADNKDIQLDKAVELLTNKLDSAL